MFGRISIVIAAVSVAACGGAKPKGSESAPAAEGATPEASAAKENSSEKGELEPAAGEESAGKLPDKCTQKGDVCLPPEPFVKRLCVESFPNVALHMFKKGTPWTRGYLTRKTNAWNASGGASDNVELAFDEEVLILRHRASDMGGMQVSGASGGYDVLRWDGSCVTLAKEEITLKLPPAAKTAKVEWRWLDEPIQESLRANEKVDTAYKTRRNECKGATIGTVSLKCVKADTKLSDVIVEYVREGGELAMPAKLP